MSRPPVSIIITSRSDKEQLVRCLEYVYTVRYSGPKQIIVVDNGSTDNSVFLVTSRYPQVKVIANEVNLGVGAALNQGIRASQGPYVAILHQDVEIEEDWIDRMVTALEGAERTGSAGSMIVFRRAQGTRLEVDSIGIAVRNGRMIRIGQGDDPADPKFGEPRKVYGISGAAAMYKREMLEAVKLGTEYFDETLFARYEDFDLAIRANLLGFSAVYVPGSAVLHKRGILWEHDPGAREEQEILHSCNPSLILTKCLPLELFKKYGRPIRGDLRKGLFHLARSRSVGLAARAWRHYRSARKEMIKKQIKLYEQDHINTKSLEWEIFGRSE